MSTKSPDGCFPGSVLPTPATAAVRPGHRATPPRDGLCSVLSVLVVSCLVVSLRHDYPVTWVWYPAVRLRALCESFLPGGRKPQLPVCGRLVLSVSSCLVYGVPAELVKCLPISVCFVMPHPVRNNFSPHGPWVRTRHRASLGLQTNWQNLSATS